MKALLLVALFLAFIGLLLSLVYFFKLIKTTK